MNIDNLPQGTRDLLGLSPTYTHLSLACALYKLGYQIPDITPTPFGLSLMRINLDKQLNLWLKDYIAKHA